jgi:hypothetical protein
MRVVMVATGIADGSSPATTMMRLGRLTALLHHAAQSVRQGICGMHGHLYVLHSEPGRLSLRCYACGAQTRGWVVDLRPACRRA